MGGKEWRDKNKQLGIFLWQYNFDRFLELFFGVRVTKRAEEELQFQKTTYTFGYLNVRSLIPHVADIKCLLNSMKFDMIALGETWMYPGQSVQIDGWFTRFENVGKNMILKKYLCLNSGQQRIGLPKPGDQEKQFDNTAWIHMML